MKGKDFSKKLAIIGEQVHYLLPSSLGTEKLDSRWAYGIWLGVMEESGEYLIGTPYGISHVRKFLCISDECKRFSIEAIRAMRGTPWCPFPGTKLS